MNASLKIDERTSLLPDGTRADKNAANSQGSDSNPKVEDKKGDENQENQPLTR